MRTVLPLVLLLGCPTPDDKAEDVDSDSDGLMDAQEAELGTDPAAADSDEDGLDDGAEVNDHGTDPLSTDSDDDGYLDPWEVTEGSDPNDDESLIYIGGWPYNPDKDSLEDPGFGGVATEGERMPRFVWVDQFGDEVDIYDFAMQGKPVAVDLSGAWCYWCQETAKLMEGKRSALDGYGWDDLHLYLEAGDFYWITILDSDVSGRKISDEEVAEWYAEFENPYVPVLGDKDGEMTAWFQPYGYPSVLLLDEEMNVTLYDSENYTAVFDELMSMYAE
jgi:hypothetical protein